MKHLAALMTAEEFARRTGLNTFQLRLGSKPVRSSILKAIHRLLQVPLPSKNLLQTRWHALDEIARLCSVYVNEKKSKVEWARTSPKLQTVELLLFQVQARRWGEEKRANELHEQVTAQPAEIPDGRLSAGKGVAPEYSWEKVIRNPNTRMHGEKARKLAGDGSLGEVELRGADWTEVRADDLYALKALFKGLDWQQITNAVGETRRLVYMGPDQRAEYQLHVVGPTIYNSRLEPADTGGGRVFDELGASVYVASQDGDLYTIENFDDVHHQRTYQHSSFLAGGEVMCAGTIKIRQGQLITISNMSGHYKPGFEELVDVCSAIKDHYENPEPAYALYFDFQLINGPEVGFYLIPMSLFIKHEGRPPNPTDFRGSFNLHRGFAWEYKNPQAAKLRGGATQI